MATGLPVVAVDAAALPDLVTDGVNGFLVPPDDPQSFAIAVLRIFGEPERAAMMGSAGLQTSRSHSDPATFDAHERLYASAIAGFRPAADQTPADPPHRIWSRLSSLRGDSENPSRGV